MVGVFSSSFSCHCKITIVGDDVSIEECEAMLKVMVMMTEGKWVELMVVNVTLWGRLVVHLQLARNYVDYHTVCLRIS